MTIRSRRAFVAPLAIAGGLLVLFVGVMGFAHTPAGRPLLAVMGRALHGGACPLGYDRKASPAQHEQAAARFWAAHRGQVPAAGRPALGLALGTSRRADVTAAFAARGISCAPGPSADLVCPRVPSAALPGELRGSPARELWLTFGAHDQLLTVVAVSRDATPAAISDAFAEVTTWVTRDAGPATNVSGEAGPSFLSSGALHQATAEFRFANYYALARATNMGDGYLLTEEYRAL